MCYESYWYLEDRKKLKKERENQRESEEIREETKKKYLKKVTRGNTNPWLAIQGYVDLIAIDSAEKTGEEAKRKKGNRTECP